MTAANVCGLARFPLGVTAVGLVLAGWPSGRVYAVIVIAIAGVTDVLDGYLARRFGTVSDFGAFLDTTMDKVFSCPLLFVIAGSEVVLLALAALVTMRDLLVTGIRAYAASRGNVIPGQVFGKIKQFLLNAAMICLLLRVPGSFWFLVAACVLEVVTGIEIAVRAWPDLRAGLFPNHNVR